MHQNHYHTIAHSRTTHKLTATAEEVMSYTLEDLLHDDESLFTALFLSHPDEALSLFNKYPHSPKVQRLVYDVFLYHGEPERCAKLSASGFFNLEVSNLLKLSEEIRIAGSRFIPVFVEALNRASDLRLSDRLQEDLRRHICRQKALDGFVIVSSSRDGLNLDFAEDVIPG